MGLGSIFLNGGLTGSKITSGGLIGSTLTNGGIDGSTLTNGGFIGSTLTNGGLIGSTSTNGVIAGSGSGGTNNAFAQGSLASNSGLGLFTGGNNENIGSTLSNVGGQFNGNTAAASNGILSASAVGQSMAAVSGNG